MTYNDLLIATSGAVEATPSGDARTAGPTLTTSRWVERAVLTSPGELVHRPTFGAGVTSYLTLPTPAALSGVARAVKRAVEQNTDVVACRVGATKAPDYGNGTISLEIDIQLRDGVRNNFGLRV